MHNVTTLGELKKSGYKSKTIKEELRDNLITKIKKKENVFKGIIGFEDTVIPEIERAILSRHNMNLLGLRGQAKTRIARQITELLDEFTPIVLGSELNDDPLNPISDYSKKVIRAGEEVSLTSTEYKLLMYFLNNPEKVISRAEILDAVWGVNYELGTNVVDVYVNYLRKKIDNHEDNKLIHTVIGMGYVLKKP